MKIDKCSDSRDRYGCDDYKGYSKEWEWDKYDGLVDKIKSLRWRVGPESDDEVERFADDYDLALKKLSKAEEEISRLKGRLAAGEKDVEEAKTMTAKVKQLAEMLKVKLDEIGKLIEIYGIVKDSIREVVDGASDLIEETEELGDGI